MLAIAKFMTAPASVCGPVEFNSLNQSFTKKHSKLPSGKRAVFLIYEHIVNITSSCEREEKGNQST